MLPVNQGNLNRLLASVTFSDFQNLNIISTYLGKEGISINFDTDANLTIPAMTGVVQSPEPYQMVSIEIHLLRSQAFAAQYKSQIESLTLVGDLTVIPDSITMPKYSISNCAIKNVSGLKLNGTDADFTITITGSYQINSQLWAAA
jgi:hypothetical protein